MSGIPSCSVKHLNSVSTKPAAAQYYQCGTKNHEHRRQQHIKLCALPCFDAKAIDGESHPDCRATRSHIKSLIAVRILGLEHFPIKLLDILPLQSSLHIRLGQIFRLPLLLRSIGRRAFFLLRHGSVL